MITRLLAKLDQKLLSGHQRNPTQGEHAPDVLQLEDRILYSVSPLPIDPGLADVSDFSNLDTEASGPDTSDSALVAIPAEETQQHLGLDDSTFFDDPSISRELVFIDEGVDNADVLLQDLLASDDPNREFEIVMLSSDEDGIEQISRVLQSRTGIDAVHLVAHGSEGRILLGDSFVTTDDLPGYAGQIASWRNSLDDDADILLYGCDLGNARGREWIESLSVLCDCDVAASDDLTGHAELGGDWEFEILVGSVETQVAFSEELQSTWFSTLDITSNLVAHYEFEEGSGTTAGDSTANNNDGSFVNSPSWTATSAVGSTALDFTGDAVSNNHVVNVPDSASLNFDGDFTVAFWYNASSAQANSTRIIGSHDGDDGFSIYANSDGSLSFFVDGNDGFNTATLGSGFVSDGNWHHIVARRSGNFIELSLDNRSSFAQSTTLIGQLEIAAPVTIGGESATVSDYEGLLDDVRIYTRQLSTSDITELFNHDPGGTLTVDTFNDTVDGTTTDVATLLSNKGADGFISLREAILAVNNDSSSGWTINLSAGTYTIADPGISSGDNFGDFDIRSDVIIAGAGLGTTFIDGGDHERVFQVHAGTVVLDSLTVQNGSGDTGAGLNISAGGNVTLESARFRTNDAVISNAGAVFSDGTLTVNNSVFDSNEGFSFGGLNLTASSITTITNSLFVGNVSNNGDGGAINSQGVLNVTNTTFSNNEAGGFSDGAAIKVSGGSATLTNVTITNHSTFDRGAVRVGGGTLSLRNTIIAGNSGFSSDDLSAAGGATLVDLGNNLIGNGTGQTTLVDGSNGNQVGTSGSPIDPLLGALADNGGPTQTHALLAGSTAIDAGTNLGAPAADQRGASRDATTDIGAYELNGVIGSVPSDLTAISSSMGGLQLNHDGGNDAYLEADDGGAILDGLSALTIELQFASTDNVGEHGLIEYTDGTQNLMVRATDTGNLLLRVNGVFQSFNAIDYQTTLFDGDVHSLGITWGSTAGDVIVYVDGIQVDSASGIATGQTINSGSNPLVIGRQYDTGGNFSAGRTSDLTLYDLRFFDNVRSANQIASSYRSDLPYDEANLIANWQFNQLSTGDVVTDSVSGNNLTVKHASFSGALASNPGLTFSLDENALDGTVVGSVTGIDAERDAVIASLLAADSDLRFNAESGKFYKVVGGAQLWSVARIAAESTDLNGVNGQLATIRSANENEFVRDLINTTIGYDAWIGGTDATVEGEWRWVDGGSEADQFWQGDENGFNLQNTYHNFASGQPNDSGGNEDVIHMDESSGLWRDADHDTHNFYGYVIEWDADAVLDATQALSYSIQSQTVAGAFTIDSDSGRIAVADGSLLDFETNATHSLTIRTTDVDGNTYDEAFTISLNNLVESNNAPSDLSSGIELNTDGGNDAYLAAADANFLLGADGHTYEVRFSGLTEIESGGMASFYTQRNPGVSQSYLAIHEDGTLDWAGLTTAGQYTKLLDGNIHSLAVTWDASTGHVAFFVDGEFVEATSVASQAGSTGGTTFVLGQHVDFATGNFDSSEAFKGTFHDFRVWDHARSAEEIGHNHQHKLAFTLAEATAAGLMANWQFDGFNGSNEVVDIVTAGTGSENNLTIANASGTGYTASTPVEDLHVGENATNGTSVGFVIPTDSDTPQDVVSDGKFLEDGATVYTEYTTGQSFGGWTVTSGSIGLETTYESSPLGGVAIDLAGSGPGAISQTLATELGQQYQVVFSLSGNFNGSSETHENIRVSADGETADFIYEKPSSWTPSNLLWEQRSFTFTAEGISTALSFLDVGTSDSRGPLISDVQVIEIPQAVSIILNNDSTLSYDAATGKFYKVVTTAADVTTAISNATADQLNGVGGQLVNIRSDYENSLVRSMIDGQGSSFYIGATDATTEGEWNWIDDGVEADRFWNGVFGGSTPTGAYSNWHPGEPSESGGGEDYAAIRESDGLWLDLSGAGSNGYVVEWDAGEVLSSFTFSLTDDAGGRFAIDGSTGEITVADGSLIDYETATSHSVTVEVTDAAGNTYSEAMSISIDNGIEAVIEGLSRDYLAELNALPPVMHLRLDESSGTVANDSSGTNDGTYHGVALGTSGALSGNDAVTFNNNEHIEVAHSPDLLLDEGTIQLWFRTSDITQDGTLFSKDASGYGSGGHVTASVHTSGEIRIRLQDVSSIYSLDSGGISISENEWHHFALSFGSAGMRLYIDGQLVDSNAYTGGLGTSSGGAGNMETLLIGASNLHSTPGTTDAVQNYYEGDIDEFAVIGSQLSDADIASLFSAVAGYSTDEDTPYVFSTANGNAVTVSDTVGAVESRMRVNVSVNDGVLNLAQTTGLTFVEGADASSSFIIDGSESAINAAFDGMTFTPDANFNGSVTLNVNSVLESELSAHYSFNGNSNDQSSGTAYDGTLNGDAAIVSDGTRGQVLSLDGAGDYVRIPGLLGEPSDVTLSAWINSSSLDSLGAVAISMGTSPALYLNASGYLEAFYESGGGSNLYTGSENLVGSGWRHIAMSIDDATREMSVYLDGQRIATISTNGPIEYDNSPDTYIGRAGDGLGGYDFGGLIDEARVYSRALSAEEIAALAADNTGAASGSVPITVTAVNDAPSFTSLDGTPTFIEGGSAVVLDSDVQILDVELGGANNFANATLTLVRNGGGNSQDVFTATGLLSALTESGTLTYNGTDLGTVTTNSGGTLVLTFDSNATTALVNSVMQSIAYSNSSSAPPSSVQIDWTFDDSNAGAQGTGGNLSATGATTVSISDVPNPADIVVPISQSVDEDSPLTFSSSGSKAITVDSGSSHDPNLTVVLSVSNGTLTLGGTTGITFLDGSSNGNASLTISGTETAINAALDGLQYQGNADFSGSDSLAITTGSSASVETNLHARYEFLGGSLEDETTNNLHGIASGDPTLTLDSERGDVLTFDGDDRVDVANSVSTLGDEVTLAAWVNLDAGRQDNIFLSIGDEFYVILDNSNPSLSMGLHVNGFTTSSLSSTHNIAGEGWNHVAATFNDVTKETYLYLNGELVRSSTFSFSDVDWNLAASPNITIGSLSDGSSAFSGSLDDVRIYNSELSASEIIQVMGDNGLDSESVNITLNAANDDPTNAGSLPSDIAVTEDVLSNVDLSTMSLSDVDAGASTLTVTLSTSTGGQLSASSGGGVTVGGTATGITFEGTLASLNAYFGSPSNIQYLHGTSNLSGDNVDAITVVVNDNGNTGSGGGTNQSLGVVNVDITAVNDAPTVGTNTGAAVAEGGSVTITSAMLNEADVDDAGTGLTYSVTSGPTNGQLELTTNPSVAISSFTQDDVDNNRVVFAHDGTQASSDSFNFSLADGGEDGASAATGMFNFTVTNANDAPVISSVEGTTLSYTENDGAVAITSTIAFSDVDDTDLESATIQISSGYNSSEDALLFTNQNGISGSFNPVSGILSLSGTASLADYETAIRSIAYTNNSEIPDTTTRTVSFTVNDGDVNSNTVSRDIAISSVNDDPTNVGSLPTDVTVTEDTASNIDLSAIDFADVDANGSDLTVTLSTSTGGFLALASDASLTFGGSPTSRTITGTLANLNAYFDNASNFAYAHGTANTFGDNADTITVVINDNGNTGAGGGANQTLGIVNVDITAVNDSPLVGTNSGASVAEGGSVTITTAMLNEADVDDAGTGLTYTVTSAPVNGQLGLVSNPGVAISSFSQDDIDNNRVVYIHDGSQTSSDSFNFSLADGGEDGASPATGTFNFSVAGANDAPVVSGIEGTSLGYTENDGAVAITSSISFTDVDDTNIESAVVQITGGYNSGEDSLAFINQLGITGVYNSSTGRWDLSGAASLADYQTAIRSITYTNNSESPDTTTRTVSFTVNDGDVDSNTVSRDITISSVNDAPTNAGSLPSDVTVAEDLLSNIDLSAVDFSDVDAGSSSLTVTLSTSTGGELTVAAGSGITLGGTTTSRTITGSLTDLNNYFDNASNIQYLHSTTHRFGNDADTISVAISDNGNSGSGGGTNQTLGVVNVDITAVNDAPLAIAESFIIQEDDGLVGDVTNNDYDADGDSLVVSLVGGPSNGQLQLNSDGTFSYVPNADFYGTDLFSYQLSDGTLTSAIVSANVIIAPVNDAPTVASDSYTVPPGNSLSVDASEGVLANDFDVEGDSLIVALSSGPSSGNLSLSADGAFSFTPDFGTSGVVTFSYVVSDGTQTAGPVTVELEVQTAIAPPNPSSQVPAESPNPPPPNEVETEADEENEKPPLVALPSPTNESSNSEAGDGRGRVKANLLSTEDAEEGNALRLKSNDSKSDQESFEQYLRLFERQQKTTSGEETIDARLEVDSTGVIQFQQLQRSLDQFQESVDDQQRENQLISGTATSAFAGATALAAVWLASGSSILALLASSLPAWASFDPIFVLSNRPNVPEDKSLSEILEASQRSESPPT